MRIICMFRHANILLIVYYLRRGECWLRSLYVHIDIENVFVNARCLEVQIEIFWGMEQKHRFDNVVSEYMGLVTAYYVS